MKFNKKLFYGTSLVLLNWSIAAMEPNLQHLIDQIGQMAVASNKPDKIPLVFETKVPLTEWPDYFYDNVYQGAPYNFSLENKLEKLRKTAAEGNKVKADKSGLSDKSRTIYDWLYALDWTRDNLLKKPFDTWTIEDLNKINKCVSRLTVEQAGVYRNKVALWPLRIVTKEEEIILKKIKEQNGPANFKEQELFLNVNYLFPEPPLIPLLLETALKKCQKQISIAKNISGPEKATLIIKAVAVLHFDLIIIHPWQEGNKRTAKLILSIILSQNCIRALAIADSNEYLQALIKSLKSNNEEIFVKYIIDNIKERQALLRSLNLLDK